MVKESIIMEVQVELNDQFFDDIICTMLEGGSNYWIEHVIIKHPDGTKPRGTPLSEWASSAINKGGEVHIYPSEEMGHFVLTKQKIINGLKDLMKAHPGTLALIHENSENSIDADIPDLLIILAISSLRS